MTPSGYILEQSEERKTLLTNLHSIIIGIDHSIVPGVESMMSKEMILYKERGIMKYGLAAVKNYMSLHCMPIYMNPELHAKYAKLLPAAKFQKGCINFSSYGEVPPDTISALITDCSGISIADMLENRKRK
ncbi:DUF1801 domain-containing protein [Mucilaginibacter rubeus]|uniref:DUF1801 domain-containing protein n=1 Tax=Mucilaginibacter rubeus TaxID=2027860 RepID=A0A5C1I611_9SPHI|nr:DUF1801 domain-containing protein [Mucilaginibacter rubeus]QEM13379.1 DUF1801 domain-containing protein [Mucilaginibacter rubeus]